VRAFLQQLFETGEVVLRDRPGSPPDEEVAVRQILGTAFDNHRLSVAGPLLSFDADSAFAAARLLTDACWFLVSHGEPDSEVQRSLVMPRPPTSAQQHLSADLLFRYLPLVHRRARASAPDDVLTRLLTDLLRQWPLSGVLADVADEPTTPLQFNDHPGLLLLYAERLLHNDRPAWRPTTGLACETWELVRASLDMTAEKRRERGHGRPVESGSG
jgi:hypothetical protein